MLWLYVAICSADGLEALPPIPDILQGRQDSGNDKREPAKLSSLGSAQPQEVLGLNSNRVFIFGKSLQTLEISACSYKLHKEGADLGSHFCHNQ